MLCAQLRFLSRAHALRIANELSYAATIAIALYSLDGFSAAAVAADVNRTVIHAILEHRTASICWISKVRNCRLRVRIIMFINVCCPVDFFVTPGVGHKYTM